MLPTFLVFFVGFSCFCYLQPFVNIIRIPTRSEEIQRIRTSSVDLAHTLRSKLYRCCGQKFLFLLFVSDLAFLIPKHIILRSPQQYVVLEITDRK